MCLIVFSWKLSAAYPFLLAANRDEFYDRPALPAYFRSAGWLGGQDLAAGGTWMGMHRNGRFAALTNYRSPAEFRPAAASRGSIVADFLAQDTAPELFMEQLSSQKGQYNGFNLLAGTADELWYFSSVSGQMGQLSPGLYGLSNHLLDTPWPKVVQAKNGLQNLMSENNLTKQSLLDLMQSREMAADEDLPATGVPYEWEKALSAICIATEKYGTRCSTALMRHADGTVSFAERTLQPGNQAMTRTFYFQLYTPQPA